MQREEWTFEGSLEVTVNIFTLNAYRVLFGEDKFKQFSLPAQKLSYNDWKNNNYMALATFALLIEHFGWTPMYTFMKEYEDDLRNRNNLPQTNQEKIDQWVLRYSKIIKRNIKPHFEMFGLPVSTKLNHELSTYEPWS